MDLTGLTKRLAVPAGKAVPRTLQHGAVGAHAITRDDLADDVAGINASLDLIRRTRGGDWPSEPVTAEGNYVDLVWHECERRDEKSFTYVLTSSELGYLGCLYLYPVGVRRRSPTTCSTTTSTSAGGSRPPPTTPVSTARSRTRCGTGSARSCPSPTRSTPTPSCPDGTGQATSSAQPAAGSASGAPVCRRCAVPQSRTLSTTGRHDSPYGVRR